MQVLLNRLLGFSNLLRLQSVIRMQFNGGVDWLLREFPRLDFIRRATILTR